ncbi:MULTISPECIES: alkaline phosphatase family protein [unclassified Legionella]|uniref:alkaline phosphatase family protein n=1 Tax=unclassified Legionella TaxID=2622702 RepID=UPI0010569173|nr:MULTISPECIES: alkaline phosphatase family protein [unclassified Legionella]MDI9819873.1 alkaline phosphatase family protein [Legionella sp. PL877]
MKKRLILLSLLCSPLLFADSPKPRLILQLVVDQLRGDLLYQYQQNFAADGFNYLLAHGINYRNAHHSHANTVTCAGHATIATGSYPALHGIIDNNWYNRQTHQPIYCVEDKKSPILLTPRSKKPLAGRSPRNLIASTLSDELVLAQTGLAFAVSFKDRAAITLAGHAGKAFWFDKKNGGFITSRHYYSAYPQWVTDWNSHYKAENKTWTLSASTGNYHYARAPAFKNRFQDFGPTFPHKLGTPDSATYYKFLSMTPFADELTADFAIDLLKSEQLGTSRQKTDYLAVSFSAVDAIGHQFGPNSLESEDNLLKLDKTLAKFLKAIDQQVGLDNTLIILTADHGVSDSPVYLAAHHIPDNGSLKRQAMEKIIEKALAEQFKLPADTLQAIALPYIYLDHQVIDEHQLSLQKVSAFLADTLRQQPGIFQAYTLPLGGTEHDWLSAKVDKMAFPGRAGDIYLVPPPFQALADKNEQRVAHGTPWQYDSYVPLLFVNPAFKAQGIIKSVDSTDIAPTLAAILSIKPPSAATGQPLAEVITAFRK